LKIVIGSWFSLPRLGTDAFSALMKAGVKYESGMGFMLAPDCDISSASRAIRRALGEDVELSVRCAVCLAEACPSCPYSDSCDRRVVSPMCLCEEHLSMEGAFENYVEAFRSGLAE
jgi:hypothetical protein